MIVSYAPNWSVIYNPKFTIVKLLQYRPQVLFFHTIDDEEDEKFYNVDTCYSLYPSENLSISDLRPIL